MRARERRKSKKKNTWIFRGSPNSRNWKVAVVVPLWPSLFDWISRRPAFPTQFSPLSRHFFRPLWPAGGRGPPTGLVCAISTVSVRLSGRKILREMKLFYRASVLGAVLRVRRADVRITRPAEHSRRTYKTIFFFGR